MSKPKRASDAEQRAFSAKKIRWLEQVARDCRDLPPLACPVCIELLHYFNIEVDGKAWPEQDTLAKALTVRREAISKAIKGLAERGHLSSKRKGRDNPNTYQMVVKESDELPQNDPARCAQTSTSSSAQDVRKQTHHDNYDVRNSRLRCAQNDDYDVSKSAQESLLRKTSKKTSNGRVRAKQIPEDWTPTEQDLQFAFKEGLSEEVINRQAERFLDYWHSTGKPKQDWSAVWRNWIRKEVDSRSSQKQTSQTRRSNSGSAPVYRAFMEQFGDRLDDE